MQFITAKGLENQLEVKDRRSFTIDRIKLLNKGFLLVVTDIWDGRKYRISYLDRESFDKEWNVYEHL
jgi:hypothetical protein